MGTVGVRFFVSASPSARRYSTPASVSHHPPTVFGMKPSRRIASDLVPRVDRHEQEARQVP